MSAAVAAEGSTSPGRWRLLPPAPATRGEGLQGVHAVAAGGRVVLVAGATYDATRVRAVSFDPRRNAWTSLPAAPLRWRAGHSVVAAGGSVIVWGGASNTGRLADGALLAPDRRRWRGLPAAPLSARTFHTAVWTGSGMIVWGGNAGRRPLSDGALYEPSRDRWRRVARGPLSARGTHTAVWTGRRMLVWGGDVSRDGTDDGGRYVSDGASYDPRADRWRRIAAAPIPSSGSARAVWTGTEMLVWNGTAGAIYDAEHDRWRSMSPGPLGPREGSSAVWDGRRLLIWGGTGPGGSGPAHLLGDGAAYSPRSDRWRRLPEAPLAPRDRHAAASIPGGMIIWGGCCGGTTRQLATGAVYRSSPARRR